MAKYCPCGCEKKLRGYTERSSARGVGMVQKRLEFLERFALPLQRKADENPEELEAFIEDGKGLRDGLLAVIHGDLPFSDFDRRQLHDWLAPAARTVTKTKITLYQTHGGLYEQ